MHRYDTLLIRNANTLTDKCQETKRSSENRCIFFIFWDTYVISKTSTIIIIPNFCRKSCLSIFNSVLILIFA